MFTRRAFIAAGLAASAMPVGSALAQAAQEPAKQADFLFVQTAKSMTFDKSTNKLNLDSVSSEDDKLRQVVAVLQAPALKGDTLTYTLKVLQGDMPPKAADVSVFIDVIGMPMTPLSYAGAARRGYRRMYWRR